MISSKAATTVKSKGDKFNDILTELLRQESYDDISMAPVPEAYYSRYHKRPLRLANGHRGLTVLVEVENKTITEFVSNYGGVCKTGITLDDSHEMAKGPGLSS